jgi:uncharacterized tellurite resistance protein B-like protein
MNNHLGKDAALQSEQQAAIAILFGCMQHSGKPVQNRHVEHLSRLLLLNQKFVHLDLQSLAEKVLPLLKAYGSRTVIEHAAPLISQSFRESLFAMICELMTGDGELSETESEIVGLSALYLGVSVEMMRIMLITFIIRNRWNVR